MKLNKLVSVSIVMLIGLSLSGCAADETTENTPTESKSDVATASQELTGWLGPISEEAGLNYRSFGTANVATSNAFCGGSYCDNVWLYGSPLPAGVSTGTEHPTGVFISEEAPNNSSFCVDAQGYLNGVITGMAASGKYSDNLELLCSPVSFSGSHWWGTCSWTPWFSEETGYATFPSGSFATGVACSGSYCDSMRYYVCRFT